MVENHLREEHSCAKALEPHLGHDLDVKVDHQLFMDIRAWMYLEKEDIFKSASCNGPSLKTSATESTSLTGKWGPYFPSIIRLGIKKPISVKSCAFVNFQLIFV